MTYIFECVAWKSVCKQIKGEIEDDYSKCDSAKPYYSYDLKKIVFIIRITRSPLYHI
jgi:hypothetical protein